jgi:RHS repeat-associated protein
MEYTYTPEGRIRSVANAEVGYFFSYDAAGRVTSQTDSFGRKVGFRYDGFGRRTALVYPDGSLVKYTHDAVGRLTRVSTQAGEFTLAYDAAGRRAALGHPNGAITMYTHDLAGRLTRIYTEGVLDVAYSLDAVGNRTRKTVNGDSVDYTYDALNRLIGQSDGKPNQTQHYTYDRVGNRLTGPAKHDAYVYEPGNRLVSDQHAQYVYDAIGNLIEQHTGEGVVYFAYDAENRLSRVTMQDGRVIEYGYDPMGRRVRRTVDGASTYFVMADEDMIAEFEGDSMTAKYIHGPGTDEPWALVNRKGTYYYHADGLGSIIALTDTSMRTVQTYEYDFFGNGAFGGLHDMKNRIKQPYAFTGREFDRDTRMYYYRARYYDPSTGRFTQVDPIGYDGGLNLYAYVGGNPVNAVDPWGLNYWRYDISGKSLTMYSDYDTPLAHFSAVSGSPRGQYKPLPKGTYRLGAITAIANTAANSAYCDTNGFCWWQPLTALFETTRDGLGIHPDGNTPNVTKGCIGITDGKTSGVYDLLKSTPGAILHVN